DAASPATDPAPSVVTDSLGFRLAVPPYEFSFPFDHAAHPTFHTEWWYYTGHLRFGAERTFGYEATFFRVAVPIPGRTGSAWRANQMLFRHLALTGESGNPFYSPDKGERPALRPARADSTPDLGWGGDDHRRPEAGRRPHRVVGSADTFGFALRMVPEKPPVVHGERGVSQKTAGLGNASHYYSFTRLLTRGRLAVGKDTMAVTGRSWMDHEFASSR